MFYEKCKEEHKNVFTSKYNVLHCDGQTQTWTSMVRLRRGLRRVPLFVFTAFASAAIYTTTLITFMLGRLCTQFYPLDAKVTNINCCRWKQNTWTCRRLWRRTATAHCGRWLGTLTCFQMTSAAVLNWPSSWPTRPLSSWRSVETDWWCERSQI